MTTRLMSPSPGGRLPLEYTRRSNSGESSDPL